MYILLFKYNIKLRKEKKKKTQKKKVPSVYEIRKTLL